MTPENFEIKGLDVTNVTVSPDNKKEVFLKVNPGFSLNKEYEVTVTVGEVTSTITMDAVEVTDIWDLEIDAPEEIKADGISNTVVEFKLINKDTGLVDEKANDVVLDLNTTYGYFSQKRLTMQNGKGQVILRSEFLPDLTTAKIDAQIIEAKAGSIYKELIGEVSQTAHIKFVPEGAGESGSQVTLKSLVSVNSNEADRVVMLFDEDMTTGDFYNLVAGQPQLLKNVEVTQGEEKLEVEGFLFDEGNTKKVTVVLARDNYLADNSDVKVKFTQLDQSEVILKKSEKTFKLQDARVPNMTGIEFVDYTTIKATFSEPMYSADFLINGSFNDKEHFNVTFGDLEFVNGQWVDNRNVATITLNDKYIDGKHTPGYFAPGLHSLEASNLKDFAAMTDKNNIGSTQSLEFNVEAATEMAEATQAVQSPEQFTVKFDQAVKFLGEGNPTFADLVDFQVLKKATEKGEEDEWVSATDAESYFTSAKSDELTKENLENLVKITELTDGYYKLELTQDWTKVYNTAKTKDNYYNDEFRLVLPEGSVLTSASGKMNEEQIILPLTTINGEGTALAQPDITSPNIKNIEKVVDFDAKAKPQFIVTMDEPVKLNGSKADGAGETLAQNQAALPETKVEFLATDKDGKIRTFNGTVVGYAEDGLDDKILVQWDTTNKEGEPVDTPQTIVDEEDNTNNIVTIVVKSISDDVGNVAATVDKSFKLDKTPEAETEEGVFKVVDNDGTAVGKDEITGFAVKGEEGQDGEKDTITITYTEAVATAGVGSAINVNNYTLNGEKLPTGTSIAVNSVEAESGKQEVVIRLPENTLNASNVITLADNIKSKADKELKGEKVFTFKVDTIVKAEAIEKAEKDLAAAQAAAIAEGGSAAEAAEALETAKNELADKETEVQTAEQTLAEAIAADKDVKVAQEALENNTDDNEVENLTAALEAVKQAAVKKEGSDAKAAQEALETAKNELADKETEVQTAEQTLEKAIAADEDVKAAQEALEKLNA